MSMFNRLIFYAYVLRDWQEKISFMSGVKLFIIWVKSILFQSIDVQMMDDLFILKIYFDRQ